MTICWTGMIRSKYRKNVRMKDTVTVRTSILFDILWNLLYLSLNVYTYVVESQLPVWNELTYERKYILYRITVDDYYSENEE